MIDQSDTRSAELCRRLRIERAVLGAPMAAVAGGRLAAAVSAGGGLGFIGGGYGDPAWLGPQVTEAGGARIGIGLITWNVGREQVLGALAHGPAALWLSFDDPRELAPLVHDAGIPLICQASTVVEAEQAAEAGAAAIVAQGNESGGHGRSDRALFGLLPAVVDAVDPIPVVAAGGIVDVRGYDAALALGAAGVSLGTRLYASTEALDVDAAKQRLVDAGGDDTVRSIVYDIARGPEWPTGYTGRSLRSPLTEDWVGREDEMRSRRPEMEDLHRRAAADGDVSVRVVWAGEGVDGIADIRSAADLVGEFPLGRA
ncbi:MAG: nitronate monooxygenase [Actinomycetota bacterium]